MPEQAKTTSTRLTAYDTAHSELEATHPNLLTPLGHISTSPDRFPDLPDIKAAFEAGEIPGYHVITHHDAPGNPLSGFKTSITSNPGAYSWDVHLRCGSMKLGASIDGAVSHLVNMVLSYWAVPYPYRPFQMTDFEIFITSSAQTALTNQELPIGEIIDQLTSLPEHPAPEWFHQVWDVHERQRGQHDHRKAEARSLKGYLRDLPRTDEMPAWARVQSIDTLTTTIDRLEEEPPTAAWSQMQDYCKQAFEQRRSAFPE